MQLTVVAAGNLRDADWIPGTKGSDPFCEAAVFSGFLKSGGGRGRRRCGVFVPGENLEPGEKPGFGAFGCFWGDKKSGWLKRSQKHFSDCHVEGISAFRGCKTSTDTAGGMSQISKVSYHPTKRPLNNCVNVLEFLATRGTTRIGVSTMGSMSQLQLI